MDIGFFKQNESITTTNTPKNESTCLVNPLLKPIAAPNNIIKIIIASIMFILVSFPSTLIILQKM